MGDRSEAGHWEGDLIIGRNNRSAAVTLTERVSRQALLAALPRGYDAPSVASAVAAALARQPRHLVRTITWDQGREMARCVGGHEILPSGGHVAARWRPTVLPSGGQQNCPR